MFGKNPIRPPLKGDGTELEIQHIFLTLQGEGPYAGWPAVFVRLGGCNLACSFCDTEFESFKKLSLEEILAQIQNIRGTAKLVVITGGEPLRQPISPLCDALLKEGWRVQLETNGTFYRPLPKGVEIVCSPKNTGIGYQPIREDLLPHLKALKFIVSASDPAYQAVAEVGQSAYNIPVYVQPMDMHDPEKNALNRAYTLALAQREGYRLSLQLHKILGIE